MYPPGHIGIALALYSPIGLFLSLRGRVRLAVAGTVLVAGVTLLPDVDKHLHWFVHRGFTHTVWFALAVGVSLGTLTALLGYRRRRGTAALRLGAFGLCMGTLAILAHLLGDVITPMGIRPFQPLGVGDYTFSLVFASDPTANERLFTAGCLATVTQVLIGVAFGQPTVPRTVRRRALGDHAGHAGTGETSEASAGPASLSTRFDDPVRRRQESDD